MIGYIRQAWLVLVLGLAFGLALAGVNYQLTPIIEANEVKARQDAAKGFFAADRDPGTLIVDSHQVTLSTTGAMVEVYAVKDSLDHFLGWAAPASGAGYADTIKLMVGLSPDGKAIKGIRVIYNQETPGLGNKIVEKKFLGQFEGRNIAVRQRPSKKSSGLADDEIQAVTGATISSQAVCDILHSQLAESGLAARLAELAGGKGATSQDAD